MAGSSRREELRDETREHKGKRTIIRRGKNRADVGHKRTYGGSYEMGKERRRSTLEFQTEK